MPDALKIHNKNICVAAILLVLAAAQARADDVTASTQQTPGKPFPTIHVFSDDGTAWDRVGEIEAGLSFHVDARGRCPEGFNTQPNSYLRVLSAANVVASASLDINTDNRSFGAGYGATWRQHSFKGHYAPAQGPAGRPEQLCNAWLNQELAGKPNPTLRRKQILAEGITRTVNQAYKAHFLLSCKQTSLLHGDSSDHRLAQADMSAKVICHGNPAALNVRDPPPRRVKQDDGIYHMDIWANPSASANYTGFCPRKLNFGGEIEYKVLPGRTVNLKYRYVATSGARVIKSDYYTTTYTSTERKNLHSWGLDFPLTTGGPQLMAPTNSGEPDVYAGNVVLEFVGAVPFHATLQPVQFKVTCLKDGVVNPAVGGSPDNFGTQTRPRDPVAMNPAPAAQLKANGVVQAGKPDLAIRAVLPAPGNERVLLVRVTNLGAAPSPPTQLSMFLPEGKPIRAQVGVVAPNGQREIRVAAPQSLKGVRPLRLRIDDPDRVAESNEDNNEFVLR